MWGRLSLGICGIIAAGAGAAGVLTACSSQPSAEGAVDPGVLATHKAPPAAVQPSVAQEVPSYRTILVNGDERTDLGERKYSEQARRIMHGFPLSGIIINDDGYCTGFTPALPPAEGVEYPTENVPLEWVRFDANGRLLEYKYSEEMLPACSVVFVNPGYACTNNACAAPKVCVLTEIQNPGGGVIQRYCDCSTVP